MPSESVALQLKRKLTLLFVQSDQDAIELLLTNCDPAEIAAGKIHLPTRCGAIKSPNVKIDSILQAVRELFPHLQAGKISVPEPLEFNRDPDYRLTIIAVFVKKLIEAYCGINPEVDEDRIIFTYYNTEKIASKNLTIICKRNLDQVISLLERQDEISLNFFTFFSIIADCVSDGTFKIKDVLPQTVVKKVKVKDSDTFYLYPQVLSLFTTGKEHSRRRLVELIRRVKKVYVPPFSGESVVEKLEEVFPEPEDVLKLVRKASEGALTVGSMRVPPLERQMREDLKFSWFLLSVLNEVGSYFQKARIKEPDVSLEIKLSVFDPSVHFIQEGVSTYLQKIVYTYSTFISLVESLENLKRSERETAIVMVHRKLLESINQRELNAVFLRWLLKRLKPTIKSEEGYDEVATSTSLKEHLLKNQTTNDLALIFTSLEREDSFLVREFFLLFRELNEKRGKKVLAEPLFLFYPWIKELEFSEEVLTSTATSKRRALAFYKIYETVIRKVKLQKKEVLEKTKLEVEKRLTPEVAFYLAKNGFSSDRIVELSKIFAVAGADYEKVYLKAKCFNTCGARSYTGVALRILERLGSYGIDLRPKDLIYLGKEMSKILNDEEFRTVVEFLSLLTKGDLTYVKSKVSDDEVDVFWQKVDPQVFFSALSKIVNRQNKEN